MSYLLWQRGGERRIASSRLVLRAAEVPLLRQAQALRDTLEQLHAEQTQRLGAAADAARAQAHDEGLAEGRRAARDELAATLAALAQTAQQERESVRNQIGALALQVVRKLLGRFAEDERLVALADTAANDVLPSQPVTLVVHPDLCEPVRERMERTASDASSAPRFDLRVDPTCARDTCRLETPFGTIDASIESQLARLEDAWCGARAGVRA